MSPLLRVYVTSSKRGDWLVVVAVAAGGGGGGIT